MGQGYLVPVPLDRCCHWPLNDMITIFEALSCDNFHTCNHKSPLLFSFGEALPQGPYWIFRLHEVVDCLHEVAEVVLER